MMSPEKAIRKGFVSAPKRTYIYKLSWVPFSSTNHIPIHTPPPFVIKSTTFSPQGHLSCTTTNTSPLAEVVHHLSKLLPKRKWHPRLIPWDYQQQTLRYPIYPDLSLHMVSKTSGRFDEGDDIQWEAQLLLWTADIAKLMREGLHLSATNFCEDEGALMDNQTDKIIPYFPLVGQRCDFVRRCVLQGPGPKPSWEGILIVFANDYGKITRFRPHDLSPDSVYRAVGINKHREDVYGYSYRVPASRSNMIYDDMPLEGWWPWPKKETCELPVEGACGDKNTCGDGNEQKDLLSF